MRRIAMVGLLLMPVLSVSAQSQGTEISLRIASIGYESTSGSHFTTLAIGNGGGVGLGFYLSPGLALEPSAMFTYLDSGEGSTSTAATLGMALPIYLDKSWGHSGVFFAPGVGLRLVKFSGSDSRSQFAIGGEVGTKVRLSDPVSLRFGLSAREWLKKSTEPSSFEMTVSFGLSVFLTK